jgi:hypothetical protein
MPGERLDGNVAAGTRHIAHAEAAALVESSPRMFLQWRHKLPNLRSTDKHSGLFFVFIICRRHPLQKSRGAVWVKLATKGPTISKIQHF